MGENAEKDTAADEREIRRGKGNQATVTHGTAGGRGIKASRFPPN
jgi:hypothetical protein